MAVACQRYGIQRTRAIGTTFAAARVGEGASHGSGLRICVGHTLLGTQTNNIKDQSLRGGGLCV